MKLSRIVVLSFAVALLASLGGAPSFAGSTSGDPLVGVSRSTGLTGGDVIKAWAVRLPASTTITMTQCDTWAPSDSGEDCYPSRTYTSGADGRLSFTLVLDDPVYQNRWAGDSRTVYCRADNCQVFLSWLDADNNEQYAASPTLEFTGSPATITASPYEQLRRKQWVTVRGTADGAAGRTVRVVQTACYHLVQANDCYGALPARHTEVRSDGTWSLRYLASRFLSTKQDCVEEEPWAHCGLTVAVLKADGSVDHSFSSPDQGEPIAVLGFRRKT